MEAEQSPYAPGMRGSSRRRECMASMVFGGWRSWLALARVLVHWVGRAWLGEVVGISSVVGSIDMAGAGRQLAFYCMLLLLGAYQFLTLLFHSSYCSSVTYYY